MTLPSTKATNKTSDKSDLKIHMITISLTQPRPPNGFSQHLSITITKISPKTFSSPHASYKSKTIPRPLKPIGWPMPLTKKTTSLKILTSKLSPLKLSISERKDPFGCGFMSAPSQFSFSHASSSSKVGSMKIITDTKDHHHLCTQMRTILQIQKSSLSSKHKSTTNGGMLVFSRDRNLLSNFRFMKIEDGKKIYFKHAGVNQPAEIPELN